MKDQYKQVSDKKTKDDIKKKLTKAMSSKTEVAKLNKETKEATLLTYSEKAGVEKTALPSGEWDSILDARCSSLYSNTVGFTSIPPFEFFIIDEHHPINKNSNVMEALKALANWIWTGMLTPQGILILRNVYYELLAFSGGCILEVNSIFSPGIKDKPILLKMHTIDKCSWVLNNSGEHDAFLNTSDTTRKDADEKYGIVPDKYDDETKDQILDLTYATILNDEGYYDYYVMTSSVEHVVIYNKGEVKYPRFIVGKIRESNDYVGYNEGFFTNNLNDIKRGNDASILNTSNLFQSAKIKRVFDPSQSKMLEDRDILNKKYGDLNDITNDIVFKPASTYLKQTNLETFTHENMTAPISAFENQINSSVKRRVEPDPYSTITSNERQTSTQSNVVAADYQKKQAPLISAVFNNIIIPMVLRILAIRKIQDELTPPEYREYDALSQYPPSYTDPNRPQAELANAQAFEDVVKKAVEENNIVVKDRTPYFRTFHDTNINNFMGITQMFTALANSPISIFDMRALIKGMQSKVPEKYRSDVSVVIANLEAYKAAVRQAQADAAAKAQRENRHGEEEEEQNNESV